MKNLLKTFLNFIKRIFSFQKAPEKQYFKAPAIKSESLVHKIGRKFNARFFMRGMKLDRFQRPCLKCQKSMFVSIGQLAYWHRECRREGRRISINARYGRQNYATSGI